MFKRAILFEAALVCASAQVLSDQDEYPEFKEAMASWGYAWEAHKITTDDEFILTTFHITGLTTGNDGQENEVLNIRRKDYMPVVLMNGSACDAVSWVAEPPGRGVAKPLPLKLYDDGFDVWLAANRGTKYCQEHTTLDVTQPEFWDWSWAEMGLYDDTANIKFIKEQTGMPKVSYLGVSQGTVQMFYALTHIEDSFLKDNLFTFAALDPCTIAASEGDEMYKHGLLHFQDEGVFAFNGPNWDSDLQKICDTFPQDACDYAQA